MFDRLLILILVFSITAIIGIVLRWWGKRRVATLQEEDLPAPLAGQVAAGEPSVLYFSTEACVQCRLQQTPVLERFAAETGIVVHKVDALLEAELADFYGVMTVPTTVVLDGQRRPIAINYGLAQLTTLTQQVRRQSA